MAPSPQSSPDPGARSLGLDFQLDHRLPVWSWANHTLQGPLSVCWYFERAVVWQVNELHTYVGRGGFIISAGWNASAGCVCARRNFASVSAQGWEESVHQSMCTLGFHPRLVCKWQHLQDPSSRETSPSSRMFSGMCACAGLCRQPWFITSKAINKTWLAVPQYIENDLQFESESQCCFSHGIGLINHTVWTAGSAMHFYSSSAFLENLSSMNQNNTISLLPMINRISLLFIHT